MRSWRSCSNRRRKHERHARHFFTKDRLKDLRGANWSEICSTIDEALSTKPHSFARQLRPNDRRCERMWTP